MLIFITRSASISVHIRHPIRVRCDRCGTRFVALGGRDFSSEVSDTNFALLGSSAEQRAERLQTEVAKHLGKPGRIELRAYCIGCRLPINIDKFPSKEPLLRSVGRQTWEGVKGAAIVASGIALASVLWMNLLSGLAWVGWIGVASAVFVVVGIAGSLFESRPLRPGKPLTGSLDEETFVRRGGEAHTLQWAIGNGTPYGQGHVVVPGPLLDWIPRAQGDAALAAGSAGAQ